MALLLKHQTPSQFAERLREFYRSSDKEQTAQLARWILFKIQVGDLTDTQLRTIFGLTAAQWNTLKTKMTNLRNAYTLLKTSTGE
jgi:hypothetical protein